MSLHFRDAPAALPDRACARPSACEAPLHNGKSSNIALAHIGTDIVGNAFGRTNSYCRMPESAYQTAAFGGMWQFWFVHQSGESVPAYCMEKGKRGPDGEVFRSAPIEQTMPTLTQWQINRIAWMLANGYPAHDPAELFRLAGVDARAVPQLNADDAYAATQVALWSVIATPQDPAVGWTFLDCTTNLVHPKSDRLRRTVNYLYNGSITMGQGGGDGSPDVCVATGCCRKAVAGGATLTDCGSLETLREACGKLLYGPLMVQSRESFSLCIEPVCEGPGPCGFITLADACGSPIQTPLNGQEFYIAFPPSTPVSCYKVALSVAKTVVGVATLQSDDPALQVVGLTLDKRCTLDEAHLCMCFAPPACCPKPCTVPIQPCAVPIQPCCPTPGSCIVPKHIFPPAPHHIWT